MFVHISPEPDSIGETISTLKFAERVATVELGAAQVNKDTVDVKELKEQVIEFLVICTYWLRWLAKVILSLLVTCWNHLSDCYP